MNPANKVEDEKLKRIVGIIQFLAKLQSEIRNAKTFKQDEMHFTEEDREAVNGYIGNINSKKYIKKMKNAIAEEEEKDI